MSFLINIFKSNTRNNYVFSFFIPIFIFFPFLFSYDFIFPKNSHSQNFYIETHLEKAIEVEDEASGIEKVVDLENSKKEIYPKQDHNLFKKNNKKDDVVESDKEDLNKKSQIKVVMLGYHQVRDLKITDGPKTKAFITSPETFEKEMKFLYENGYHTISTTDYINYLNSGNTNLDLNKSIILTFDDGYVSQYTNAFPILKKYGFTATFFIYMDCIDKYPACMTTDQIKDLSLNNMKIGNHTLHHAYLPKYTDDNIRKEIEINKQKIINMVGTSSVENIFAYPYGGTDERVESIVKDFGYDGAVGVMASKRNQDKNLFNLRRYLLGENYNIFEKLFK